ncbi:phage tail assembly protein [Sulfuricurvum sp.]|uniref:phage tail assembly protein n=1 Tax=Sulfuricurvum sp. TaxID=2025608 RepID=UPI00261AE6A5|nr:phage tail assembly protein [Sulfuricurvum sp.]MDD2267008.1 phage tail assembly protein [Sulfuricurvum sp.]MDD2782624.1 phage tail assembly protein [Sulfuricurvum sp.]
MKNVRIQEKKIKLHDDKEVTMRRPKARDLITASEASNNPAKQEAVLIANLCMMTIDEVEDLDADDFMNLTKERNSFL